jgi:hypothetical protein
LSGKAGLVEMKKVGKREVILIAGILILAAGCGRKERENQVMPQKAQVGEADLEKEPAKESLDFDEGPIAALYCEIYDQATEKGSYDALETVRSIVEGIGELGYVVADEENQINMAGAEQVLRFYRSAEERQEAELTIIVVSGSGELIKYDLHTADGTVDVVRGYYQYINGTLESVETVSYPADLWEYTKEGYLLFGGSYYSESYYALSLSDEPEYTALRVEPLDERCRELNRMYLLPVGYGENNLFLVDWSEQDFGNLNFYDLFDRFYPDIYGQPVSYAGNDNCSSEAIYRIPAEVFEYVIESHVRIDHEELQKKTTYYPEDQTYEYRPRGFYEVEYPEIPYPEVVSFTKNSDGTITLIVNAVYPEENTSRAYTHKTVVRPLDDGGFQYVSNQILFPEGGCELWWHSERLTEDQWKEIYGGKGP